nr:MAG TPA: hypothetical protein [Caudoviricetes sp.]
MNANILETVIFLMRVRCDIVKFLTAFEIREKYKNDKVISYAFAEQMRLIEEAAKAGGTGVVLLRTVDYYINEKGETVIGITDTFEQKRQRVDGVVLEHFLNLGYKKTKVGVTPYLSWAERLV